MQYCRQAVCHILIHFTTPSLFLSPNRSDGQTENLVLLVMFLGKPSNLHKGGPHHLMVRQAQKPPMELTSPISQKNYIRAFFAIPFGRVYVTNVHM